MLHACSTSLSVDAGGALGQLRSRSGDTRGRPPRAAGCWHAPPLGADCSAQLWNRQDTQDEGWVSAQADEQISAVKRVGREC